MTAGSREANATVSLRDDLNQLAPRVRRFMRAVAGPGYAPDGVVAATLRRVFDAGAKTPADARMQAFTLLLDVIHAQPQGAAGARGPSFAAPGGMVGGGSAEKLRAPANSPHPPHAGDPTLAALYGLKLEEREALLLVVAEQFSYEEAARILRISRSILAARLLHAREHMPKTLQQRAARRRGKPLPPHLRVVK